MPQDSKMASIPFSNFIVLLQLTTFIKCKPVADYSYGIILDGGSSGTKSHLFRWLTTRDDQNLPQIEEIYYKKHRPGIGSFVDQADGIQEYLAKIIEELKALVPEQNKTTVIYFMATAGFRLLGEKKSRELMNEVKQTLGNGSINPFHMPEDSVRILSGEEEAIFSWITINYMTRKFYNNEKTFGLVEIGGASVQIAFVPEVPIFAGKTTVHIGNHNYDVYTHSFLSYGATAMKNRIHDFLLRENPHATAVTEPCMLKGDNDNVVIKDKQLQLSGGGNTSQCQDIIQYYLAKVSDSFCSPKPCSIGSVYTPSIPENSQFIGLSVFYSVAAELRLLNESGLLDVKWFKEESIHYCSKTLQQVKEEMEISERWASSDCRNALYIPLLLNALGFTDDVNYQLYSMKRINGDVLAWSLGAMIYGIEKGEGSSESKENFDSESVKTEDGIEVVNKVREVIQDRSYQILNGTGLDQHNKNTSNVTSSDEEVLR